jgi:hypothetical protein
MARKKKRAAAEEATAELLPAREALSLWPTTDPAAYTGMLADPTATGGGAADPAASAADSADDLVNAQAAASEHETVSDQPQTIAHEDTQTASTET